MTRADFTDPELLLAIAGGDTDSLGALYDRYGRLVYSLAWNITGEDAAAEEVAQDVFMQVWNRAQTYNPSLGKVTTWLTSVTRNRAIDWLRRRGARAESRQVNFAELEAQDLPDTSLHIEGSVEIEIERQRVRLALAQLPNEQKRALELAFFGGLSHQDIARATGEPLGTIKTRIRLGMQKVRQMLEER